MPPAGAVAEQARAAGEPGAVLGHDGERGDDVGRSVHERPFEGRADRVEVAVADAARPSAAMTGDPSTEVDDDVEVAATEVDEVLVPRRADERVAPAPGSRVTSALVGAERQTPR